MTIKELKELDPLKLETLCHYECETKQCPISKKFWKYRVDGFCILDSVHVMETYIIDCEAKIEDYKNKIKKLKKWIKDFKKKKDKLERMLDEDV